MAELPNDTGSLWFRLDLVDREAPLRGPAPVATEDGRMPSGRLLASASIEYLDRRDGERWPLVRLAVLYLSVDSARALVAGLSDLLQGNAPGFAWRSGDDAAVGLQIGAPESPPGEPRAHLQVDVGLDLSLFLQEAAGAPRRPAGELALFRFSAGRPAVVAFADAVRGEAEVLLSR
jgi:hypothetical protein